MVQPDGSPSPGLSPRVRGSPDCDAKDDGLQGSIPACAGEPLVRTMMTRLPKVYPRVCGGAQAMTDHPELWAGLSPRVRGSPRHLDRHLIHGGSIPACAGEPASQPEKYHQRWVYPRVCGGAVRPCVMLEENEGLSPRVRGSHPAGTISDICRGSIPACAGEPFLHDAKFSQ